MTDFIYKISFFTVICGFVAANSNVEVKSDIEKFPQDLNSQNVTFTCDASNFTRAIIQWFIDNRTLASYRFNQGDMYPFLVDINPPIPGINVQLGNLDIRDSFFSFQNFTLTADICSLIEFNGKSLSCGLTLEQRAYIPIDINLEGTLNATYEAVYQNEELTQVDVHWKDVLLAYQCVTNTSYMVLVNPLIAETTIISNANCSNSICSASFQISDLKIPKINNINYEIVIMSINEKSAANGLNSSVLIMSTLDILEKSGCDLLVTCPASFSQNCSLMIDSEEPIIIEIGKQHKEELNMVTKRIFNFMAHNGSIVINDSTNHDAGGAKRNYAVYIGVGLAVFGAAVVVLILGCICGLFIFYKHCKNKAPEHIEENTELQQDDWCFCKAASILIIAPIFFIVIILILWIVYAAIPSGTDVCPRSLSRNIAISTMTLSFVIIILSVMVFGGLWISYNCNPKKKIKMIPHPKQTEMYSFTFGMSKDFEKDAGKVCSDCNESKHKINRTNCEACGKVLCTHKCRKEPVFIFHKLKKGFVCNSCKQKYWKENEIFLSEKSIDTISSDLGKNIAPGCCTVCKNNLEEKKECKCKSCGNSTCGSKMCYVKREVVCNICYMLNERKNHTEQHPEKILSTK